MKNTTNLRTSSCVTVLHVDDDPSVLAIVSRKLELNGIKVVSTTNPMEAIKLLMETGARVVLLDIDMPHKDGLTLLHEVKQLDGAIQVIMCTGIVSIHTVLRAAALGAEECIFKPFVNLDEITEAVDRAFKKIDRWWHALRERVDRGRSIENANVAVEGAWKLPAYAQSVFCVDTCRPLVESMIEE